MDILLPINDIQNIEIVKKYLMKVSTAGHKHRHVYINICNIYQHHTQLIKEILKNISEFTYYKDYFYILQESSNKEFDEYIITLIIEQLKIDIKNMSEGKQITTLGKYLPADHSKINKATKCVPKIIKGLFERNSHDYRSYRKLKKRFNEYLGMVEPYLCTQQHDKIEFNKLSEKTMYKYRYIFMKKCPERYTEFINNKLSKMTLNELVNNRDTYDKLIINKVFEKNKQKYKNELDIKESTCIIDLSNETFKNNKQYIVCGTALLFDNIKTIGGIEFQKSDDFIGDIDKLLQLCHGKKELNDINDYVLITSNIQFESLSNVIYYPKQIEKNIEKHNLVAQLITIRNLKKYIMIYMINILIIVLLVYLYKE